MGELGVGCSDSLAGLWGLGREISPLVEMRRGQKLPWAGGGALGVGGLVAAAGAKGALVTSERSPLPLPGVINIPPPPEILGCRSGRPDTPLGFPGVGGFIIW